MVILNLILILVQIGYSDIVCNPEPGTPPNDPFGKARGIVPGRVAWAYNTNSTSWDGKTGFWWEEQNIDLPTVKEMLLNVICNIADQKDRDLKQAWDRIFTFHNHRKHGELHGYEKGEKIVIKMNLNGNFFTYDSNNGNQVSPQFLVSLVDQFVNTVGIEEKDIYFYDASRLMTENFYYGPQGMQSFFPDVNFYDNKGGRPYVTKVTPSKKTFISFSDPRVPDQNKTRFPDIVENADYMIEINDFRAHNGAGFTGSGKNWFGSIYRPSLNCSWPGQTPPPHFVPGPWCPKDLHPFVHTADNPMGAYNVLVDLLSHPKLGDNVLIFLMDGLYGGLEETWKEANGSFSNSVPIRFKMSPFNDNWTSSVFASLDPLAIDSVQFDFMRNEPNIPYSRTLGCVDNYLHESALLPKTKTKYNPTGEHPLDEPLGIHEHWNNADEKLYSRNKGKDFGIELVRLS